MEMRCILYLVHICDPGTSVVGDGVHICTELAFWKLADCMACL